MVEEFSIGTGIRCGLGQRSPHCAKGRLFLTFLKVKAHSKVCRGDSTVYPSDDAPSYATPVIVGRLLPLIVWMDRMGAPALWILSATRGHRHQLRLANRCHARKRRTVRWDYRASLSEQEEIPA
jgi:uncharacterized protein (DUF983 family)